MYRLTPRQAIVIVTHSGDDRRLAALRSVLPEQRFLALREAILRDVLAAAIQVDGATISVLATTATEAGSLRRTVPAGIDLLAPIGAVPVDQHIAHIAERAAEHGVERLLVLDAATLALASRQIGTALSVLGEADLAIGGFASGSVYAFGFQPQRVGDRRNGAAPASDDVLRLDLGLDVVLQAASMAGLRARRLEPRPTLDAFADVPALLRYLDGRTDAGRFVSQWRRSCMPPVMASGPDLTVQC